ncbi:MAG TPA: CDP-alcohol phosphatidyltransferase family protein [Anaerolineaceae bacterium]|uniref:Putative phosphatidylinositol synthase n=1 Tax=Anaerolinea thermophila TaxID=167964 RepID=A0A101FXZ9_9CHLR|nr:MAG: Putative phosphatidylinositol synthase [Anaerolinea thermophila]HAF62182.1 CDP-alcohol phosphatidyltransferase family protein [Anaerolineaceae bacterium]
MTFTDRLRVFFRTFLEKSGQKLLQKGISANAITLTGMAGNMVAAVFIARGNLLVGGILILCMGPLDAFDGAVARAKGEMTAFGAFLDSVTDRYSELVVFFGLLVYFVQNGDGSGAILSFIAAAGSILVSYTRARAEGVGYAVKAGLMTRVERYLVLVPGIIFGIPKISLWIIAILANVTAIQRVWIVWKESKQKEKEK